MTDLETTLATAKARDLEAVRRIQAQIAELAPYAEAVHPIPKHPAPGCSCFGCVGRDDAKERRAEDLAAERMNGRMTDRECDRRADLYYGDLT